MCDEDVVPSDECLSEETSLDAEASFTMVEDFSDGGGEDTVTMSLPLPISVDNAALGSSFVFPERITSSFVPLTPPWS